MIQPLNGESREFDGLFVKARQRQHVENTSNLSYLKQKLGGLKYQPVKHSWANPHILRHENPDLSDRTKVPDGSLIRTIALNRLRKK